MKYMVLIAGSEEGWAALSEEEERGMYGRIGAWWGEQVAAGKIIEGYQLQPTTTATTVRVRPNQPVQVTDGPFIEGKESVGGYAIIDVADLDEAIALVSGWPGPDTLEIRPIIERMAEARAGG